MLSYFLSRRRLLRSFEACKDGFLYRRRPTAAAISVTDAERAEVLTAFKSAYWRHQAILWASSILLVSVAVALAVVLEASAEVGTAIGYVIAAFLFIGTIYVDRRVIAVATESLGNRRPVQSGKKWLQLVDDRLQKDAWWRFIVGGALLCALAWLTRSILTASLWGGVTWVGYFGFCFGFWARNVWRKWRLEARN